MSNTLTKAQLISLCHQVKTKSRIDAALVGPFLEHEFPETSPFGKFMLRVAAWISLFFASVLVVFPEVGEWLIRILPGVFELPPRIAKALDYIWSLVGKPVKKTHLMYHLPNIIIYSFGVAGLRQLIRKINKNNWKDRVIDTQQKLSQQIDAGTAHIAFPSGFSVLLAGAGDQVAKSLVKDDPLIGPTLSSQPQPHTKLWGKYVVSDGDEGFERVLDQFNCDAAGEFVMFPVVDNHLFLPGPREYDVPPHRIEIGVQRIREFEREKGWARKRIVIVGDKEQTSRFITSGPDGQMIDQVDVVSLNAISEKYENVIVADPTDITLKRIMEIADGRQIAFRASQNGTTRYCEPFFQRLALLGYAPTRKGTLTVGYDITDLETEHQILAHHRDEYLPVILSRDVFDLLSKSHLKEGKYIFVPRLVKEELQKLVA